HHVLLALLHGVVRADADGHVLDVLGRPHYHLALDLLGRRLNERAHLSFSHLGSLRRKTLALGEVLVDWVLSLVRTLGSLVTGILGEILGLLGAQLLYPFRLQLLCTLGTGDGLAGAWVVDSIFVESSVDLLMHREFLLTLPQCLGVLLLLLGPLLAGPVSSLGTLLGGHARSSPWLVMC